MSYSDELSFVSNAKDNVFPTFLFTPMYNDFEDNYYQKSITDDALSTSVRGLRRKYSNFFDYCDAIGVYNEYMDKLMDKYGSMSIIKNGLRLGLLEESVPPKPKVKNTKRNREFLRAKSVPSRPLISQPIDADEYIKLSRLAFPNAFGEDIDEEDRFNKLDKNTRKMLRKTQVKIAGSDRRHNLYRSTSANNGADFIVEYLNQATKGYYEDGGERVNYSILDIVKEEEKYSMMPPELIEAELSGSKNIIVNGRMVRAEEFQQIELMKQLYGIGIDVLGNFGKSMNKQAVKMIRSTIGDTEPMTKKELKQVKKRAKRDRETIERRQDNDKILQKTLLNNKFDFSANGNSINFKLKDLYRD